MEKKLSSQPCQWLTVDQLERKLNISRSTVYRWMRQGVLQAYRFKCSRSLYFLDTEVDDFLRSNAITHTGRLDKTGIIGFGCESMPNT